MSAGPIYTLDEMFEDPQVKHSGAVTSLDHPKLGKVDVLDQPINLSRTPPQFRKAPPELGKHTEEVLMEAGTRNRRSRGCATPA